MGETKTIPTVTDMMHDGIYITAFKEALRIIDDSEGDLDFAKFKIRNRINSLGEKYQHMHICPDCGCYHSTGRCQVGPKAETA